MELNSESQAQECCPYCDQHLSQSELQHHLDCCDVYQTLIRTFSRNSVRSRLYSAIIDSRLQNLSDTNSEDELPSTMRYLDGVSDSSSLSSLEDHFQDLPVQQDLVSPSFQLRPARKEMKAHTIPTRPSIKGKLIVNCPVCFNEYHQNQNTPLVLPSCGHTVCEVCLNQIVEHSSVIKCPVCRTLNFKEVDYLPVNYALLEIAENKDNRDLCSKHQLEIVGYCKDEEMLLCGACVFEHKDHQSFLLTDQRSLEVAQVKKNALMDQEMKLMELKKQWQQAMNELNKHQKEIVQAAEIHIYQLEQTEKKLIAAVKEGTKACINQTRALVRDREIVDVQEKLAGTIEKIEEELGKLKEKQCRFEQMSMVEKLSKIELIQNPIPLPSLEPAAKLSEHLKTAVDYKKAIKNKQFSLNN